MKSIKKFEKDIKSLKTQNFKYILPINYNWDYITNNT